MSLPPQEHDLEKSHDRMKKRPGISESVRETRTTLLIDMVIECASAVILLVGFAYFVRFLFFWRERMVDIHFKIFLVTIISFSFGWTVYFLFRIHNKYRLFRNSGENEESATHS